MTTDLIKRLRMVDDPLRFGLDQEAANEIERLRERAEAAAASWNALQRALKEIERQSAVIRNLNGQCDHLGIKLGEVIRERDALRAFALAVMEHWPLGDVDGGSLQDYAVKHGLLTPESRTAPCSEDGCNCAEYYSADEWAEGIICYRKSPLIIAARREET
jgi:hypothetical protein